MERYNTAYNTSRAGPSPSEASSSRLLHRQRPAAASTSFEPLNAHDRLQRMHALRTFYENSAGNRLPAKPRSRGELDVLRERHQFVRDSRVDPSTLPWEDQLASKFYDSLFKEYAVVNLKHYKSGAVALRWRTEEEVLSGIGHLTCGSLRCRYHEPSPSIVAAQQQQQQADDASSIFTTTTEADLAPLAADPDSETPLVEARLEELEMPFGYLEQGVKKSVLVKVVLCRECAKKLRYGRQKARELREEKEERELGAPTGTGLDSTTSAPPPPPPSLSSSSSSKRQRHRHVEGRPSPPPPPPSSARPPPLPPVGRSMAAEEEDDDNDFRPELPPDMDHHHGQQERRRHRHSSSGGGGDRDRNWERCSRERRRSASPPPSRRRQR